MGEPLNNYDAVLASIRGMSDSRMFKLSPRHITLSTVGVVPRMKQLTQDAPETQLALSLHAPNQASVHCTCFFRRCCRLVVIVIPTAWRKAGSLVTPITLGKE